MKKIKIIAFLLIGTAFLFSSCEDLEEEPDFTTAENFFTNPEQLEIGVNGVYDVLGYAGEWFNHFYNRYVFECQVGYQVGWEKGPLNFQNGIVDPSDIYIDAYWKQSYDAINSANTVIESADKLLAEGSTDDDLVRRVQAEAKFLRSFFYFNLIRYFDDVPFTDKRVVNDEVRPTNENGKVKVIAMMNTDLTAIADVLPAAYGGGDVGRATKWAALTLLMKGQLLDEDWTGALATAQNIVDNSGITLYDNFSHNFEVAFENQGERIFEAQVSSAVAASETNNHHAHFVPADMPTDQGGVGWHWLYGTKDFRMQYDDSDLRIPGTFLESYPTKTLGRRSDGTWPMVTWSENAEFTLTTGLVGIVAGKEADDYTQDELIFGRPHNKKWFEFGTSESWEDEEKNIVYLRYADVLLGHSEAANESNTGDPYFGINAVRERAGLSELSGLSPSALRDAIVNERVLEFAFEQETYPELKRKSTFGGNPDYLGDYIQRFIDTYGLQRQLKARDYVLPIPLVELLNNSNVEQHDVWK
ncbi:RagB/SusD family nutrient uptake outer membrane protein [Fulvivirga sp. M361]|uniref:RagB/SusD family nutrient uptake outer membrane protein n=1 Tax=Fulvivirga sp. M361 TaxID=2594266 RepID=UPI00117A4282|nr:RagB/SusD family nutrient uptake outer membrane protein [Fulvivirga sp. M361]TRX51315.1 RagB/SusD family nutrient uptake outer membrane protein [Fulvivirga sp. M361]